MWRISWLAEARLASQEVLGVSLYNYPYLLHTSTAVKPPAIAKPTAPFNRNDISLAVRSKKQSLLTLMHSNYPVFLSVWRKTDNLKPVYQLITTLIPFTSHWLAGFSLCRWYWRHDTRPTESSERCITGVIKSPRPESSNVWALMNSSQCFGSS
jgi:hypothetical protein